MGENSPIWAPWITILHAYIQCWLDVYFSASVTKVVRCFQSMFFVVTNLLSEWIFIDTALIFYLGFNILCKKNRTDKKAGKKIAWPQPSRCKKPVNDIRMYLERIHINMLHKANQSYMQKITLYASLTFFCLLGN
jgi:hypothetical protein